MRKKSEKWNSILKNCSSQTQEVSTFVDFTPTILTFSLGISLPFLVLLDIGSVVKFSECQLSK